MARRTARSHPSLSMGQPANRLALMAINLFCLVMASLVRNRIAKGA